MKEITHQNKLSPPLNMTSHPSAISKHYEGGLLDGLYHGYGTLRYGNDSLWKVYSGEFLGGKCHGKGKMEYGNGGVYDGEWKDGSITHGTYQYANHPIFKTYTGNTLLASATVKARWNTEMGMCMMESGQMDQ
jgi:hypothetical protein